MVYLPSKWHLGPSSRLTNTDMGRKLGVLCPFGEGELGPYNTLWPGPRPASLRSSILIHPAVWPQQTWAKNWRLCPLGEGSWVPI